MRMISALAAFSLVLSGCASVPAPTPRQDRTAGVNLSPSLWPAHEYQRYLAAQGQSRTSAGEARGENGAVTVAYNAFAARAGLEALKQGGNAADAALTAAMAQVALTGGAPVSYFGILSLVYYDAETKRVHTMNAEWNTLREEVDPLSIPGGYGFHSEEARRGLGAPSGRTALVGGFMKGVEEAHRRFGKLPFHTLFEPSIHIAEEGFSITADYAEYFRFRQQDLARLPATREAFLKPDGSVYREGELFRQPALARTLRAVAAHGADYMYRGPWAERLVAAIRAEGGRMTLEDLSAYEVIWSDPLVAPIGGGYEVHTTPWPNSGGVALIEAQNLAAAAGLVEMGHWSQSGEALRTALDITQQMFVTFLPPDTVAQVYPGMDFSPDARVTQKHARELWSRMQRGAKLANWKPAEPRHSDDVVVIDGQGNIAAITHSINTIMWGKTAITVDGITIGDPASFQQAAVAQAGPGQRLPAPTQTGVLFKDGSPVLGFASMGSGLHHRTFQGLLNYTRFGMSVAEAINTPDFYFPQIDPANGQLTMSVPEGRFDRSVLAATGYAWREVPLAEARLAGEGKWVAISRDPATGELHAASHNRNNSAAVAY